MAQVFNLVPPSSLASDTNGKINKKTTLAGRFPLGRPNLKAGHDAAGQAYTLEVDKDTLQQSQHISSDAPKSSAAPATALLLKHQQQHDVAATDVSTKAAQTFQGIPQNVNNLFMLTMGPMKGVFTVTPITNNYTFKPLASTQTPQDIDELEKHQAAVDDYEDFRDSFMPKSVKHYRSAAADAREQEIKLAREAVEHGINNMPHLTATRLAELSTLHKGAASLSMLYQPAADQGSDDKDDLDDADDDIMTAAADGDDTGRGPRRGAGSHAGARKKGRKGGRVSAGQMKEAAAGFPQSPEARAYDTIDDQPEDIFAGEEDDLRPEPPKDDATWDWEDAAADDDLDQGGSDEGSQDDDTEYRQRLGLHGDDGDADVARRDADQIHIRDLEQQAEEEAEKKRVKEEEEKKAKAKKARKQGSKKGDIGDHDDAAGTDDPNSAAEEEDDDDGESSELTENMDIDEFVQRKEKVHAEGKPKKRPRSVSALQTGNAQPAAKQSRLATQNTPLPPAAAGRGRGRGRMSRSMSVTPPPGHNRDTTGTAAAAAAAVRGNSSSNADAAQVRRSRTAAGAMMMSRSRSSTPPLPPRSSTPPLTRTPTAPPAAAAAAAGRDRGGSSSSSKGSDGTRTSLAGTPFGTAAMTTGDRSVTPPTPATVSSVAAKPAWQWQPDDLDAGGVPTVEGLRSAMQHLGSVPVSGLLSCLAVGHLGVQQLQMMKQRLTKVVKGENREDGTKYLVLK